MSQTYGYTCEHTYGDRNTQTHTAENFYVTFFPEYLEEYNIFMSTTAAPVDMNHVLVSVDMMCQNSHSLVEILKYVPCHYDDGHLSLFTSGRTLVRNNQRK